MEKVIFLLGVFASTVSNAQSITPHRYHCGGFRFEMSANSMFKMNSEFVAAQKITALGNRGVKMDMTLMPARDGNMDQPRIIGIFNSKRVAD